jgi:tetratricopeptide (TPR) repeat protein
MGGLADRIGQRFRLLASTSPLVPTRQQTLLAALDWSHDLLSPQEQTVFRRLGVFAGHFSLEMAVAVVCDGGIDEWTAIDAIAALVDRSLVEVDTSLVPRYRLLESARAYAVLKMQPDELAATNRALARALLDIFVKAERESWSWVEGHWVATYGAEMENMRAALDWCTEHDRPLAVGLVASSRFLHEVNGLDFEMRTRCERVEPGPDAMVPREMEAHYWLTRAMAFRLANREHAVQCAGKAEALYRALGDGMMLYITLATAALSQALDVARTTAAECAALQRPEWPPRMMCWGVITQAFVAMRDGRDAQADAFLEQGVGYARACGSDFLLRRSLGNIADRALATGGVAKAVEVGRELMRSTPERHYHALVVRGNLGNALMRVGEVAEARRILAGWIELSRALHWDSFPVFAQVLPLLAASEGRYETAARLLGYAWRRGQELFGDVEVNEQFAYDLAMAQVQKHLDAATVKRLMDEGASLDEESVCALTLERSSARAPAMATQ